MIAFFFVVRSNAFQGSLIAIGDSGGVVTLTQLCDGLVNPQPNEKNLIGQMFDRETRREKNLEAIKKAQKQPGAAAAAGDEERKVRSGAAGGRRGTKGISSSPARPVGDEERKVRSSPARPAGDEERKVSGGGRRP